MTSAGGIRSRQLLDELKSAMGKIPSEEVIPSEVIALLRIVYGIHDRLGITELPEVSERGLRLVQ